MKVFGYAVVSVVVATLLLVGPIDWLISRVLRPEYGLRNPHSPLLLVWPFVVVASFVILRRIGRRVFR